MKEMQSFSPPHQKWDEEEDSKSLTPVCLMSVDVQGLSKVAELTLT